MAPPILLREGRLEDVIACTAVWRSTISETLPPPDAGYDLYAHEVETGTLMVAELDGQVRGFGGSLVRGDRWFLADLFVSPALHGQGVGRRLLESLMRAAEPAPVLATMGSTDYRALALYTQRSMTPRWPCLSIKAAADRILPIRGMSATVEPCDPDTLIDAADRTGYRLHGVDVDYWLTRVEGQCVMVRAAGAAIGGAVIRWTTPFSVADPTAVSLGPVFATGPDSLLATAFALLQHVIPIAAGRSVRLYVPGPNPALQALLQSGFHIEDFDFFCASDAAVLDPLRVFPSHDLL